MKKKKNLLNIIIFLLSFMKTFSIIIYQCSTINLLSDQCMLNYTDKNGDTHILLKICPENTICQAISDYSMGFCITNIKEVYPGDDCNYNSQCSTRDCSDSICYGFEENKYCNPNKMECKNNMSCRKIFEEYRYVYKCLNVSEEGEKCENNNECGFNMVCGTNFDFNMNNNMKITRIKEYIEYDEYLSLNNNKSCIKTASLQNGIITNEEMACKSGQLIPIEIFPGKKDYICGSKQKIIKNCDKYSKCIIEVDIGSFGKIELEQECIMSVIGNLICPLNQKELAWKNYLNIHQKNYEKEKSKDKIHIPYNKYTLKNGEVSKAWWEYNDWIHSIEGDECSKDYFFIKNGSNEIRYKIYYLISILFIFIILIL